MAQLLVPVADVTLDSWQTAPLWSNLDEASPNDSDIINTVGATFAEYECELQLSAGLDPLASSGHQIYIRANRGVAGVAQPLRVRLVQGSTVIAEFTSALADTLATYTYTLSGAEADSITNYADLRLRIRRVATGLTSQFVVVSWAGLSIPDAGFAHLDIDPSGPGLVVVANATGHYLVLDGPGYRRVAGIEGPGSGALVLGANGIEVHA